MMKEILIIALPITGMLVISYLLLKHYLDKEIAQKNKRIVSLKNKEYLPLKMQAYERAILFLERIDPNNLVMRVYKNGMSSQFEMTHRFRSSFNDQSIVFLPSN